MVVSGVLAKDKIGGFEDWLWDCADKQSPLLLTTLAGVLAGGSAQCSTVMLPQHQRALSSSLRLVILRHGYYFFVQGRGRQRAADPREIDVKLLEKFDVRLNTAQRYYRKKQGVACVHYLRHRQHWILIATHGKGRFWDEHFSEDPKRNQVKDVREVPIHFDGYSIRMRRGDFLRKLPGETRARPDGKLRVRVLIGRNAFRLLKAELLELSTKRETTYFESRFWNIGFEPYAPVRRQLRELLRMVNAKRKAAGLPKVPYTCIRFKRRIVKVFDRVPLDVAA